MVSQLGWLKKQFLNNGAPMNAAVQAKNVQHFLEKWRFGQEAPSCILLHAAQCSTHQDKHVGEIVISMGLSDPEKIKALLVSQPSGVRSLDWFRDNQVKGVALRKDEILCIRHGDAYLSQHAIEFSIHSVMSDADSNIRQRLNDETSRLGFIPLQYGRKTILLFADHDKYLQFKTIDRHTRDQLEIVRQLKRADANTRPEDYLLVIGSDAAMSEYRRGLNSEAGDEDGFHPTQYINQSTGDESPVLASLVNMINVGLAKDCNDIAFKPSREDNKTYIYYRQYQRLIRSNIELAGSDKDDLIRVLATRSKANIGLGKITQPRDGNLIFNGKNGSAFLRLSFLPLENSKGESVSVSIRLLPRDEKNISLKNLNIPDDIIELLQYFITRSQGLFLVCGPTNSGKSTTVGGMLCYNNEVFGDSVKRISLEQPVERFYPNVEHVDVSQLRFESKNGESAGKGSENFNKALRALLRHDPDIINVGEVRDAESCSVTVDAANTGHLVTATTHANSPVMGFRRLASFLPPERVFDLVSVLEGILAQRLVKCVCDGCGIKIPYNEESSKRLKLWANNKGVDLSKYTMPTTHVKANKDGCEKCIEGYAGMRPIHGLLMMNPEIRRLLLSRDENDWVKAEHQSDQGYTLFDAAFKLFNKHMIDIDTLML